MRSDENYRVWIDLANSPHVLFFKPVIEELQTRGVDVFLTARRFAQTIELLEEAGLQHEVIGKHGGRNLAAKSGAILARAAHLVGFAKRNSITLAVHHNSYAQAVAARVLGIPTVALMDYEYQPANHVSFRLANKVLMPDSIPLEALAKYRLGSKLVRYPGIKEDLYFASFLHDKGFRNRIGCRDEEVLVVLRPPPDMAAYHRFHNPLFDELVDYLDAQSQVRVILLPRTSEQRQALSSRRFERTVMPDGVFDGMNLVYNADVVITAGGTMGREAAVAGTPAFTVFAGHLGGVDAALVRDGRLGIISEVGDFDAIPLKHKQYTPSDDLGSPSLVRLICDEILSTAPPLNTARRPI